MYLPHPATGQLKIKIGLLLCLILLGFVPVCQCWVADGRMPVRIFGIERQDRPCIVILLLLSQESTVPDLPGCITTGATYEDVQKNIREAIALHLRGMVEDHEPIPVPQTTAEYADVSLPDSAA
jgi:predicted RNase H-like HicB family nuclease